MRFLLDENFPLRLCAELLDRGFECDHIILLGLRGITDRALLGRIELNDQTVFLTQDEDFADMPPRRGRVVISRVSQSLPIQGRVDLWMQAIDALLVEQPAGKVLEITSTGALREVGN